MAFICFVRFYWEFYLPLITDIFVLPNMWVSSILITIYLYPTDNGAMLKANV